MNLFLLLFLLPQLSFQSDPRGVIYNGTCMSDDSEITYCLPYANSSILTFLNSRNVSDENCVNLLNEFLSNQPGEAIFEFRSSPKSAIALSFLKTNQSVLDISSKILISNKKIDRKFAFPDLNPRDFFYSEIEFETAPHNFAEEFRFMHNFLFHLAYLDEYSLKADIFCLPKTVDIPLFTFTDYEIGYLLSNEISIVKKEREIIRDLYFFFKKILGINYDPDQRKKLFFGETELRLDDFIYLYYLIKAKAVVNIELKYLFLPPLVNHLEVVTSLTNVLDYEIIGEKNRFLLKTRGKVLANTELSFLGPPKPNKVLFLYKNLVPDENDFDCFSFEFFEEGIAKELNEPKEICLPKRDFFKFRLWYVAGMIMNYKDQKTIKKCREYLSYTTSGEILSELKLETLVDGKFCKFVKWETKDIWENAKESIEEIMEVMKANIKVAKEYEEYREKENLGTGNSVTLRRYYEKNLEYLQSVKEEIKFYEDWNQEKTRKTEL